MTQAPQPPYWPHCGYDAHHPDNPVGCRGIHVPGYIACLAHLGDTDRATYLAGLAPGADIDHRGTPFTDALLATLLQALTDPSTEQPHLGAARFEGATFSGDADFRGATFSGDADFRGSTFSGDAEFEGATFSGDADFEGATFSGQASFDNIGFGRVTFSGDAGFEGATFSGVARFRGAAFSRQAWFFKATFSGDAEFFRVEFVGDAMFAEATFSGEAWFDRATFSGEASFGSATFSDRVYFYRVTFSGGASFARATFSGDPGTWQLASAQVVVLSGAVFVAPLTMDIVAAAVDCVRTRWESTATLRLRHATVDLTDAVLSAPVAVTAHPTSLASTEDDHLADGDLDPGVRVASVQGVDAAHLVLTDTDLTSCLFSGAFHLDQLRLEGRCNFAPTPTGIHWRHKIWPYRWTSRRTLAEEHHWRALAADDPAPPQGWNRGPHHPDPDLTPGPEDVVAVYRQLRKGFEDSKNEPGAADFYYGEMEMRRHDRTGRRAERGLLWVYWLLSGYGLRALRAVGWLVATMSLTVLLLMQFGLPHGDAPRPTHTVTAGQDLNLNIAPLEPDGKAAGARYNMLRLRWATRTALNSVVFRSAGEGLTASGTFIEMTSRFVEPILLILALLAVRNRVKR